MRPGGTARAAAGLRPETQADAAFRLRLFRQTRGAMFAGLDPALADLLLRQQCAAQDAAYRAAYPRARFEVVLDGDEPVGRIVSDRGGAAIRLVDVALLPERRGLGLGSGLVAALMAEARGAGLPLRLSVAADNDGARRLYRRLGFRPVAGGDGLMREMEWTPP